MSLILRIVLGSLLLACTGCYAPLHSPGIPAGSLPEHFRIPEKSMSIDLNYAMLTMESPDELRLEPDDVVRVEIEELIPRLRRLPDINNAGQRQEQPPLTYGIEARVTHRGKITLPLIGPVAVAGLTLDQAHDAIVAAYADGFIDSPRVSISVVAEHLTRVMVMGEVAQPNVYQLPKYSNDIAHALASAGGLGPEHADEIQVHRRRGSFAPLDVEELPLHGPLVQTAANWEQPKVLRIPLRALSPVSLTPEQVTLRDGDVIVVPKKTDEVFFVVGPLSTRSLVRFSLGKEDRDIGNGFLLPDDRDVDVVTAVAMAGYIDPIDSPTTVTVHRTKPDGCPMLIHVDLIAARFDRSETIMVQPGDIIYLNPDFHWWFRRTFDRVLPELLTSPYNEAMSRFIDPNGINN